MIKNSKIFASLLSLALITSCQSIIPASNSNDTNLFSNNNYKTNRNISGIVEFPSSLPPIEPKRRAGDEFGTKATLSDIATNATVSLIYPSNHSTYPNKTIATGLTEENGNFIVNPPVSFTPAVGDIFVLEASRRIGSGGNDQMSVRTYLRLGANGWESISKPGIKINKFTTALCLIADYNPDKLKVDDAINVIDVSTGNSIFTDISKIVFVSNRTFDSNICPVDENDCRNSNNDNEIYWMNPDGTNLTRLTNNTSDEINPVFSPDGTKIVFSSNRDGNYEIYTMNLDGTNPLRLTNNTDTDVEPTWSYDGLKIAFVKSGDIYIMNSDGSNQNPLVIRAGNDNFPSFSGDNSKISFHSTAELPKTEIYTVKSDGTGTANITNSFDSNDQYASWSQDGTKITFSTDKNGNYEIYTMDANGSNPVRLTTNTSTDTTPSWSYDNKKIVFEANRNGNPEIYVMNADATNQTRLTTNTASDKYPDFGTKVKAQTINDVADLVDYALRNNVDPEQYIRFSDGKYSLASPETLYRTKIFFSSYRPNPAGWGLFSMEPDGSNQIQLINSGEGFASGSQRLSPDGTKIVYNVDLGNNNYSIYIMHSDGSNKKLLTTDLPCTNEGAVFSVDGKKLFYHSTAGGGFQIYSMNIDGSNKTPLTTNAYAKYWPLVSPDGTKIVYYSAEGPNNPNYSDLWVMNSDGSSKVNLTNSPAADYHPDWSPDGTKIVFGSNGTYNASPGYQEIFVMNSDANNINGSDIKRLTDLGGENYIPKWSPDGTKIVFVNNLFTPTRKIIYVMNANGSNLTRISDPNALDNNPVWSPDSKKIIFSSGTTNQIFSVNPDGTNLVNITNNSYHNENPKIGVIRYFHK